MIYIKKKLVFVFALICLLSLALPSASLFANADRDPAVPFSLDNLAGTKVTLDDYRGQVVLVNFWATWCPPCVHELPSIQALKDHFSEDSFEVLGMNMGEATRDINLFLKQFKTELDFPILLNADQGVSDDWKVIAMPTTLIIDKTGHIAVYHTGPKDWNGEEVQDIVALLLKE